METWERPALTEYSFKDFPSKLHEAVYYWERTKYSQIPDQKFHKT